MIYTDIIYTAILQFMAYDKIVKFNIVLTHSIITVNTYEFIYLHSEHTHLFEV